LIYLYLQNITKHRSEQKDAVPSRSSVGSGARVPAGAEPGRLGILRKKLLHFLETSSYYQPFKMLSKFPRNELLEERAILLSRINQHSQVRAHV